MTAQVMTRGVPWLARLLGLKPPAPVESVAAAPRWEVVANGPEDFRVIEFSAPFTRYGHRFVPFPSAGDAQLFIADRKRQLGVGG